MPACPSSGLKADLDRYLDAGLFAWRVFRLGPDPITLENVQRLERQVKGGDQPVFTRNPLTRSTLNSWKLDPRTAKGQRKKWKFASAWNLSGGVQPRCQCFS